MGQNVKIIQGRITHLQHHTRVEGGPYGVGTSYTVTFEIGLQHVEMSLDKLPAIQEGDDVAAAGVLKQNGIFYADVYRNFTRNIYPEKPSKAVYALGVTLLDAMPIILLATGLSLMLFGEFWPLVFIPFPAIALAFGMRGLKRANVTRAAVEALLGASAA